MQELEREPEPVTDPFAYGGQAVLEGVMMRGRRELAVAVRAPSGEIVVWSEPVTPSRLARRVRTWPFVRGAVMLWDTMALGMRALMFSATAATLPDGTGDDPRPADDGAPLAGPFLWATVAVSILAAVGLFFVLPLIGVAALDRHISSSLVSNLVEGGIRLAILIGYIAAVGLLPDIRRVYGYHGAEHKTIHAWEAGDELDPAHVRRYPLEHPRCGTGFLLVVVLLSILVFLLLGRPALLPRIASRIVLVPVIAGIAYEFLKFGAKHAANPFLRVILQPSLKLQRLTTREPDPAMLEVAIAALLRVLVADGRVAAGDPRLATARRVDVTARPLPAPTVQEELEPAAAD